MSLELSENEELFDMVGFTRAERALSNVETLEAIQKSADELTKSKISLCFTKLGVDEHTVYFVIDDKEDVSKENRNELRTRLCAILDYDAVTLLRKEPSSNMSIYSRLVLISPVNYAEVVRYVKEYSDYIERKPLTGSASFKEKQSDAEACKALGLMPSPKRPKPDIGATLPDTPSPRK